MLRIVAAALALVCASPCVAQQPLPPVSYQEVACLAYIGYTESRGESAEGEYLVQYTAYMRAADNRREWGGWNLCEVAYKRGQFDGVHAGVRPSGTGWERSVSIAFDVVEGRLEPGAWRNIRYFLNPQAASSGGRAFFRSLGLVGCVEQHCFYQPR